MKKVDPYNKMTILRAAGIIMLLALAGFLANRCVTEFVPAVTENNDLLVVEGLITDQDEADTIKISRSLPLGSPVKYAPLPNCTVYVTDNTGNQYFFYEYGDGKYYSDPRRFRGVPGRSYKLHIKTWSGSTSFQYESDDCEMVPVPPLDTLYYKKVTIDPGDLKSPKLEGCQLYLSTADPENKCRFFRWNFIETWVTYILWPVDNNKCWITENSKTINIKSTDGLSQSVIKDDPVYFISNNTDRLKWRYSILMNQYSLNENEFNYWQKLKNVTDQTGGLYDIIPSSIKGNIHRIDNPDETVLGYFSVSAKSSKRLYVEAHFSGIYDPYPNSRCVADTVWTDNQNDIPGINQSVWALMIHYQTFGSAGFTVLTKDKFCADCTLRGTNVKPDFWTDK